MFTIARRSVAHSIWRAYDYGDGHNHWCSNRYLGHLDALESFACGDCREKAMPKNAKCVFGFCNYSM